MKSSTHTAFIRGNHHRRLPLAPGQPALDGPWQVKLHPLVFKAVA